MKRAYNQSIPRDGYRAGNLKLRSSRLNGHGHGSVNGNKNVTNDERRSLSLRPFPSPCPMDDATRRSERGRKFARLENAITPAELPWNGASCNAANSSESSRGTAIRRSVTYSVGLSDSFASTTNVTVPQEMELAQLYEPGAATTSSPSSTTTSSLGFT